MATSLPPGKKRKINPDVYPSGSEIQHLEAQLVESATANTSLNSLVDLIDLLNTLEDPHDTSKAIYALYRVFVVIISTGKFAPSGGEDAKIVRTWIWDQLNSYVEFLSGLLKDEEEFLRVSSIISP